ncbi:MAG: Tat pathway signal sequence domain protein [Cyanobacteria bacterium RYN_339]|nr:Tat pathway signal sequence domain protein [Cyanobacteria bacterium RYN_339]
MPPLSFGFRIAATLAIATLVAACSTMEPAGVLPAFADEAGVRTIEGAKVRVVTVDLADPKTVLDIGLAGGAAKPNQKGASVGAESFEEMVARAKPAASINGTFFSEDGPKHVMGDMVRAGQLVKFTPWEDGGTTFILHAGNRPEMVTERAQGAPDRSSHWLSMTGGPRLLRDGKVYLHPKEEGFRDPDVFASATRTALGYDRSGSKLLLVSILTPVSLAQEAKIMKAVGTYQAMNLDGGTSQGLAVGSRTLLSPGRKLTNTLNVYDGYHPAPTRLASAWTGFSGTHPDVKLAQPAGARPGDRWIGKLADGQSFTYAGLRFTRKDGTPTVGVLGDRLSFSEGNFGQIYAAFPKPQAHYALDFEARLIDERMSVALGADLTLEARRAAPGGLFLRKGGVAIARSSAWVADNRWHRFHVVDDGRQVRVSVDGRTSPILVGRSAGPGEGLGLSGRGEYRAIKLSAAPKSSL